MNSADSRRTPHAPLTPSVVIASMNIRSFPDNLTSFWKAVETITLSPPRRGSGCG